MHRTRRRLVILSVVVGMVLLTLPAAAGHDDDPATENLHPLGHIEEPASLLNPAIGNPNIHTDIAFRGGYAFQGT